MGFKQIESHNLPDIQSQGTLYEHEETGGQVLHLQNDDPNKAFSIGFRTPPYSDNGITHILEHSVLNGSRKFPSKEPFVELIKGSLNTFVNAMTFSDKTLYPVASTNEKDFNHLMAVYLDAVFQPLFIDNPQILAQEGWHHHLEDPADDLIYKGVVYNEMKGANASPERQLHQAISSQLYPTSIYRFESGGDPQAIPTLTQDEFIAYHQTYYHPSNALTVLYGDLNIDTALDALSEYFDGKGKLEKTVDLTTELENPRTTLFEDTYSITAGDDPTDKDFLAVGWHVADPDDVLDSFGLDVLDEILLGSNQAPLKKALLDADVGGVISGGTADFGYPTAFYISAKYSDKTKLATFKSVIKETLETLVKDGIDKQLIQAALNKITFQTKEAAVSEDNPRGVIYAITALSTWLYDKSPFPNLQFSHYLDILADKAESGYFEQLIEEKLLKNDLKVEVVLTAEPGKNDAIEAETHEKLQTQKAALAQDEINELVEETHALIERQETPDDLADLAKIPTLQREDLNTDVADYPLEAHAFDNDTTFYHADQFTAGIDYLNLYFDIKDFDQSDYELLGYLSKLLAKLSTKTADVADLQTAIDTHTGGIYSSLSVYENQEGLVQPYFVLSGKALEGSLDKLVALMKDIISNTEFSDQAEISKLTQRFVAGFENMINNSSHVLAANRAMSQINPSAKLKEAIGGIDQFNFLKDARDQLKEDGTPGLIKQLGETLSRLLNKNRLNVLYTGSKDRVDLVKDQVKTAFADIPSEPLGDKASYQAGTKQNEAYLTSQDVNYVGVASNASDILAYDGSSNVLSTAIRYDYLWNEVRVKGGAYGSLYVHRRNGNFALSSYRDPNIEKTLAVYDQLPAFVDQLSLSEEALNKFVIGTMSPLEQPKSAASKGLTALNRMKTGISVGDLVQLKQEILNTTVEQMSNLSGDFEKVLANKTTVVIGNKTQIEAEADRFDQVNTLY